MNDSGWHISANAARSGIKLGVMRYVLGVSLAAAVVAFLVVYRVA